jgi:hypothetical protein
MVVTETMAIASRSWYEPLHKLDQGREYQGKGSMYLMERTMGVSLYANVLVKLT